MVLRHAAAGGVGEHFRAEIRGDHLAIRALVLDFQRQIPGAGRHVEQARGFPFPDARGDDLAPPDVRAAAQHVVGEHVAVGDPGEGIANVGGILHGRSLGRSARESSDKGGRLLDTAF